MPVSVDKVEAFLFQMGQVADKNVKGIFVSSNALQKSALKVCRTSGLGVYRYLGNEDRFDRILYRTPSASVSSSPGFLSVASVDSCLCSDRVDLPQYDYVGIVDDNASVSPMEALRVLCRLAVPGRKLSNDRLRNTSSVPFVHPAQIEELAVLTLREIKYSGGQVDLGSIAKVLNDRDALEFVDLPNTKRDYLGTFRAQPPEIAIYEDPVNNQHRRRFTTAHEFGHWILGHSRYLLFERVYGSDIESDSYKQLNIQDISRLEWQANMFASYLLLPQKYLEKSLLQCVENYGIRDRGHGLIYVDGQPVNMRAYQAVLNALIDEYDVSKQVVKRRLVAMKVLHFEEQFKPVSTVVRSIMSTSERRVDR